MMAEVMRHAQVQAESPRKWIVHDASNRRGMTGRIDADGIGILRRR